MLRCGHVVSRTDSVGPHILHDSQLAFHCRLIDSSSQRTQIMVQTNTAEFYRFAIEKHPYSVFPFYFADTYTGCISILQCSVFINRSYSRIECRAFGCPKLRIFHRQLVANKRRQHFLFLHASSHFLSFDIQQTCFHFQCFVLSPVDFHLDSQAGKTVAQLVGCNESSPRCNRHGIRYFKMHIAVQSCSGIPARRLRHVLQTYGKLILSGFQIARNVEPKGIVAVRPVAHFFAIDINARLAHRTVEIKHSLLRSGIKIGNIDHRAVPAHPDIREGSGTAGFFCRHGFSILHNCNFLQVDSLIKRSVNRPVVRYGHRFPCAVVERNRRGLGHITFCKLPAFFQRIAHTFGSIGRHQCSNCSQ